MHRIIRSKITSYTAMVAESKPNTGDNLKAVRCEITRTFRNRKREYVNEKNNDFERNNKNKNIRLLT
jgi:hypothetical protein